MSFDSPQAKQFISDIWQRSILPALSEYIRIPNKSPLFDKNWQAHGYMDQAAKLLADWCRKEAIADMKLDIVQLPHRTPVIFIEIPGNSQDTVLLYGHMDKQPEMQGWDSDLNPWQPVIKDGKLYGRGGADDGYAVFAALSAVKLLRNQQLPHARCVILIEASEESGSIDLPYYIEALQERIGQPSLVVCLDSGCDNYDQLWVTTSLRGLLGVTLTIETLTESIHSGYGSGVVPGCFRIFRQLLTRIEDENTGEIKLADLHVTIPTARAEQAIAAANILNENLIGAYPLLPGIQSEAQNPSDMILNRTWRPKLAVTGMDGLPTLENAGNVTLPTLSVKLSLRLPPTCDAEQALAAIKDTLTSNPPYAAKISFSAEKTGSGWNAPAESPWLHTAIRSASLAFFGKEAVYRGEGGSIPFMGMLGKRFPNAQFLITGVLGPHSNAHGPNEFLHLATAERVTGVVASVIAAHYHSS